MMFFNLYNAFLRLMTVYLESLLARRAIAGKEDPARMAERTGLPGHIRNPGPYLWIHAASVGEAQSALTLVSRLLNDFPTINILLTTVTVTSAKFLEQRLPAHPRAVHQYVPIDHPGWVERFIDYWQPFAALWIESELWPGLLGALKKRCIPAYLINARLSTRSYQRWRWIKPLARNLLSCFDGIFAQSSQDAQKFIALGAACPVLATGNLKYSAPALPCDNTLLNAYRAATNSRPIWLYASTHAPEEAIAARIHLRLRQKHPGLLTIISPRHPQRGTEILKEIESLGPLEVTSFENPRGEPNEITPQTDILYINRIGAMGLFYRLAPVVCMGRSLSQDGGGGHNPIEPAQLNCAILFGPHVQFQKDLYDALLQDGAAIQVSDEVSLEQTLDRLFATPAKVTELQQKALSHITLQAAVVDAIMKDLKPKIAAALDVPQAGKAA